MGAVGLGVSGTLYLGWSIFSYISEISLLDVAKTSFLGGFLTAAGVFGVFSVSKRLYQLKPEQVFKHAMRRVQDNKTVLTALGGPLRPAAFKAYSYDRGNFTLENIGQVSLKQGLWPVAKSFYKPQVLQV
jgi:hypothetical protein